MIFTIKTMIWHERNADGSLREPHCCGCFHVSLDEDAPHRPYLTCNECGEVRVFTAPGITLKE